jgi:hypothetical protein
LIPFFEIEGRARRMLTGTGGGGASTDFAIEARDDAMLARDAGEPLKRACVAESNETWMPKEANDVQYS